MARLLPRLASNDSSDPTWIRRVADNLQGALKFPRYAHSSSRGAALHFTNIDLSARHGSAQAYAAIVHATLLCAALFLLNSTHTRLRGDRSDSADASKIHLRMPHFLSATGFGKPSLGPDGGSGNNDPRHPTHGELAPRSSMPLAPPRLPQQQNEQLPAPPAVSDPNAPANVPVVTKLGLPWMKDDSDSSGLGEGHGIGNGNGNGMGDGSGDGEGESGTGPYANVLSPVACRYLHTPMKRANQKFRGKLLSES